MMRSSGTVSGAYDVHVDAARAQRRRDLEADEARTDDRDALCGRGFCDQCPAVREGAQVVDLRIGRAGNRQVHRVGAGREQ
jgi:hypothetical protein